MMKTKFNFWGVMAAAAIILSAGAGYASATSQDEDDATHYNAESNPNLPPDWKPILPGSPGENDCSLNTERPCKAVQQSDGSFNVILFGNLE